MKPIRIGIFGAGRGLTLSRDFARIPGCEIVALCDSHRARREAAAREMGTSVAVYEDFDAFLSHEMDAVVLANLFHEHAPYAIQCLARGLHVFSECLANGTMAEGVALIRAAEKSNAIYMLAENYPQRTYTREMRRLCDSGTLGKILYAEGEYNHPSNPNDEEFRQRYVYCETHWRNFLPATYYITHALGPVMMITGATPCRVNAMAAFCPPVGAVPEASYVGDQAAMIMTQNDDGSIFRVTGCSKFGGHHVSYRVCGTKGQIENLRGMGDKLMLRYNAWELPEGKEEINCYEPDWNDPDAEILKTSYHGGGDYLTARMFIECIREGKQPPHPFDVHSAVTMSSVAILGHRSVLEGGKPYDIPDFHNEACRKQYENDRLSPFWGPNGEAPTVACCSHPDYQPTEEQLALYRKSLLQ